MMESDDVGFRFDCVVVLSEGEQNASECCCFWFQVFD